MKILLGIPVAILLSVNFAEARQELFNWRIADQLYRAEGASGTGAIGINQLQGEWKRVAVANNPRTNSHRIFKTGIDGDYPEGVKNFDGSIMTLVFLEASRRWNSERFLAVNMLNLGRKSGAQGSNPVVIRGRDIVFNQYFYLKNNQLSRDTLAEYSCRFVPVNRNSLICAVTPRGTYKDKNQAKLVGQVIVYYGFVRDGEVPDEDATDSGNPEPEPTDPS